MLVSAQAGPCPALLPRAPTSCVELLRVLSERPCPRQGLVRFHNQQGCEPGLGFLPALTLARKTLPSSSHCSDWEALPNFVTSQGRKTLFSKVIRPLLPFPQVIQQRRRKERASQTRFFKAFCSFFSTCFHLSSQAAARMGKGHEICGAFAGNAFVSRFYRAEPFKCIPQASK